MRSLRIALGLSALVALTAVPASAQWFADVYIGGAKTPNDDAEVRAFGATTTPQVNYRSSVSTGARLGRWLDPLPWLGLAVDVSYFKPDRDIEVIPISALIMARLSLLKDEDFPEGRLHPYLGAGPALFISRVHGTIGSLSNVSDSSVNAGADVRAGVALDIEKNLGLFTEYRFTHVAPDFSFTRFGATTDFATTFNTHHFVIGVSFKF